VSAIIRDLNLGGASTPLPQICGNGLLVTYAAYGRSGVRVGLVQEKGFSPFQVPFQRLHALKPAPAMHLLI
jgi:hypothetical protein